MISVITNWKKMKHHKQELNQEVNVNTWFTKIGCVVPCGKRKTSVINERSTLCSHRKYSEVIIHSVTVKREKNSPISPTVITICIRYTLAADCIASLFNSEKRQQTITKHILTI